MRGNPYSRGFDPMKSRSERRKEKQAKLSKTKRVIRLKKRLGRITARKFAGQEESHMSALMESYILRRKAERAAEKAKESSQEVSGEPGGARSSAEGRGPEQGEGDNDDDSGTSTLGSTADSVFEMDGADDGEGVVHGDIATSRRRAAQRKRGSSARGGGAEGAGRRHRRGNDNASWPGKRDNIASGHQHQHNHASRRGQGEHHVKGERAVQCTDQKVQDRHTRRSSARIHDRSRKVPTRSLY
ncbi:hypothetical protein JKF63_02542 [Porcisia hertigi]|uniref:Uncharacterized protein n=1 Tax=Porcisia hertigi TaxID=2761500 RepID=A0A836IF60_9TRYP|nr:hypothetical protein JKF63_02542 [Porcisia hertigi]